jgi:hypothetical protein
MDFIGMRLEHGFMPLPFRGHNIFCFQLVMFGRAAHEREDFDQLCKIFLTSS